MAVIVDRLLLIGLISFLYGCGNGTSTQSNPTPPTSPAPQPSIVGFSNPVPAGSPGFTALVDGSGFTTTSVVLFNNTQLQTSFQTDGILYATLPSSLLVMPGTVQVVVKDTNSGNQSNAVTYAILSSAAASAGVVQLVSSTLAGSPANGESDVQASISATGRFVVFQSNGTNLVSQQVIMPWENIYLSDTCLGASTSCTPSLQLISISADGTTGGNWQSRDSTVSQDGRFVAFDSGASNLLAQNPSYCNSTTNCVFLRDTCMGAASGCVPSTTLASVLPSEAGNGGAQPVLTPSGRYLTFDSNGNGSVQTYRRDLCYGAPAGCSPSTVLVSANNVGNPSNEGAQPQSISANGRFVGFVSYSTNLIDPSQPAVQSTAKMFTRDTCEGSSVPCSPLTSRVDVPNADGTANNQLDYEAIPSLSGDGRYIAYSSNATNLVSQNVNGFGNVYLRDTCFGATGCAPGNTLVSVGNDGFIGNSGSHQQSMSADGRFIAFTSIATNLVWGIAYPAGSFQDVYVRDICTGAATGCYPSTVRVAVNNSSTYPLPSDAGASLPAISADGHYIVFLSSSTNLTAAGTDKHTQVFLAKTGF